MFSTYPRQTRIRTSGTSNDGQICLDLDFDTSSETPDCIASYLLHHGWSKNSLHPDTGAELWQNNSIPQTQYGYYSWEQAVAFQMFLFMNIGPNT